MSTKWTSLDIFIICPLWFAIYFWLFGLLDGVEMWYHASVSLSEQVPRSTMLSQWWSQPSAITLLRFLRFRQMMTCKIQRSSSNSWSQPTYGSFASNFCWNSTKMAGHCLGDKRLKLCTREMVTQLSWNSTSTRNCTSTIWQADGIRWESIFMSSWSLSDIVLHRPVQLVRLV